MNSQDKSTLVLDSHDVQNIIHQVGLHNIMDALIERIEEAIKSYDPKISKVPTRSGFQYDIPHTGLVEWMPIMRSGEKVVLKCVGYHPNNPTQHKLPTILSSISAYDTKSGHLMGLMDCTLLTALRTGAASAIASKYMAHPDSKVIGIIGAGAQAITQLHALSRVFAIEKVLFYDIDQATVENFAERSEALELSAEFHPSGMQEIIETCDIVCTATSIAVNAGPLFDDISSKETLHINAVGSDFPGKTELPLSFLNQAVVTPDFYEQAVMEGECQQLDQMSIGPDLADIVKTPEQHRSIKDKRSVFDSTGWALEDQVAMDLFMEYAIQLGIGKHIEIEYMPTDAKNPYEFMMETMELKEWPSHSLESKNDEESLDGKLLA